MIRLITIAEIERLTDEQLRALHKAYSAALVRSDYGTAERRNSLASLENIDRVMRRHAARGLSPPGP